MGTKKNNLSHKFSVHLKHPLKYDEKRDIFLKGYYEDNKVISLNHQKSFKIIGLLVKVLNCGVAASAITSVPLANSDPITNNVAALAASE